MKKYKMNFYNLSDTKDGLKGNTKRVEFFDTLEEAKARYKEVYKKELKLLNPTVHEYIKDEDGEGWKYIFG